MIYQGTATSVSNAVTNLKTANEKFLAQTQEKFDELANTRNSPVVSNFPIVSTITMQNGFDQGYGQFSAFETDQYSYFYLPTLASMKIANLSALNFSFGVNYTSVTPYFNTTYTPTSDYTVPVWLSMGFGELNTSTITGNFSFEPILNFKLTDLKWYNGSFPPNGFYFKQKNTSLDLTNTLEYRNNISGMDDFQNTNDYNRNYRITKQQLDKLTNSNENMITWGIFIDTTGLTGNNALHFSSNQPDLRFCVTFNFQYFGVLANFVPAVTFN